MVSDCMSYTTISNVVESWENLRRIEDYKEKAGVLLFKIFFRLEPAAAKVFDFSVGKDGEELDLSDEFFKSPKLVRHAKYYMSMVDRAVGLLGPDIELLTEILLELGVKHERFGVKASYYVPMGQALIQMLEELLGKDKYFTDDVKDSWLEVYQALSYDMIRAKQAAMRENL